ncbi:MAG: hypothetical protein HYZ51_03840 [Candidatus Doudnabacteria bacterium]|nr:hypothetical protein [Candidatus Doudnabacteria bacterium]
MTQNITITLDRQEKEQLNRLALRYGLSLPEFSRKVLTELNDIFPQETFAAYKNPKKLKKSLGKALLDWQNGRVQTVV